MYKPITSQAKAHNLGESEVINKVLLAKQAVNEFITAESIGQMSLLLAAESVHIITSTVISMDGGCTAQ